jgi:uncharacterized protein Yka (UPF0111/DUF47 family)
MVPLGLEKNYNGLKCSDSSIGLYLNDTIFNLIEDILQLYNNSKGYLTITEIETVESAFDNIELDISELYWNTNETLNTITLQRILKTITNIQDILSPFMEIRY